MSFVRVLAAAAAAVLLVSSASAQSAVLAATEPDAPAADAQTAPPQSSDAVATTPAEENAGGAGGHDSGHHASDAALPAAEAAALPEEMQKAEPLPRPEPTLFADINLATQTLTVSDETGELYRWPISSARGGYVTPTGSFRVNWTSRMHYSRQYDWAPMPYAVFFNKGVAVHGTNAVGSLGRPASHGCVRLHPRNAKTFYNLVHKHGQQLTKVVVHGTPPYSPAVADRQRRRYQAPVFQPFGFFAYEQPAPQRRRAKRQRYGGGYYQSW